MRITTNVRINGMWQGEKVAGSRGLHEWVRRHLQEPEYCENCKINRPYDLANVTAIYSRDLLNWRYLCRKCHIHSDGRTKFLILGRRSGEESQNYGRHASEETRTKISRGLIGNKNKLGYKDSEETRIRKSLAHVGKHHGHHRIYETR